MPKLTRCLLYKRKKSFQDLNSVFPSVRKFAVTKVGTLWVKAADVSCKIAQYKTFSLGFGQKVEKLIKKFYKIF